MAEIGLLFPGQGAQAPGMGQDLCEKFASCRALFDTANEVLGYDLASCCFDGPAETLTRSDVAQPAIFTVSVAAMTALRESAPELEVAVSGGLSSGEWAALYAAGCISFEDALRLLQARGKFMQEACEARPGGMLSVIGLDSDTLQPICEASGLEMANLNSPGQTVLSGPVEGLEPAEKLAGEAGARKAVRLKVAGAFHSSLMRPAAEQLAEVISQVTLNAPAFPVCSNVTGQLHEADPELIRKKMVEQVYSSVRWIDNAQAMEALGISVFAECGPGKVLAGLFKRIDKSASVHNIYDIQTLETTLQKLF